MANSEDETIQNEDGAKESEERPELGADEVYCTSCGAVIKEEAEVCPECGVRQTEPDTNHGGGVDLPDGRIYELQKIAQKSPATAVALGLLLTPASYWYVGRTGLALVNFLTLNYLLLGFIVVPIHTYKIIQNARDELNRAGEGW